MALHIAVCDDQEAARESLGALAARWASERGLAARLDAYPSAESLLFAYEGDKSFDILLLDIQMGGMDGLALARTVRRDNDTAQIVFVTAYPDYAAEGYEVAALHYLLKPVSEEKLFAVLDRAEKALGRAGRALTLSSDGALYRVPLSDIFYAEAQGHAVVLHTAARTYTARARLADIERSLGDGFFRCQRSFVVGLSHIRRVTRAAVELEDGTEVPLSRELYDAVNRAIIRYFP